MFSSQKRSNNYDDIKAGETLFDFLKRKKKFALDQSISRSRCKENVQDNSRKEIQECSPKKKYEETYRQNVNESRLYCQTTRRANNISGTPKKVTFNEGETRKSQNGKASFIEMISPMKKKQSEGNKSNETIVASKSKGKQKEKEDTQEHFYRKNLNKSISVIKSTLQKLMNSGKTLKQKSHNLFVELKPILKHVEEGENRNFSRRAEDVQLKLRSFEHMFKEFDVENGNSIIEQFHRNLSEHIISYEGNIRSNYERSQVENLRKLKSEKDVNDCISQEKIHCLSVSHEKLGKQVQILSRKLQKSQKLVHKLQKNGESEWENYSKVISQKISDYEMKISQYEGEISQLSIELDNSKLIEKRMEKEIKDLKYLKQEAEKRFLEENTKINTVKEEYLLNEVEMLKKQFKTDMSQIHSLYSSKEQEQIMIIEQLRKQLDEVRKQKKIDEEVFERMLEETKIYPPQIEKLRKQNECLVTDLHRMNEELYQHWLALKDMKTLSTRLGTFNKFIKIYEDMSYNDQLFL